MTTLADFFEARWRDDDQPASWHIGALPAMWASLQRAGVDAQGCSLTVGPASGPNDVAAYVTSIANGAVPAELADSWREVGPFRATFGALTARWLSPREILAEREPLRARIGRSVRKAHPEMDVLALVNDKPALLFDPTQTAVPRGEKVWYHMADGEPYAVLGWIIAIRFTLELKRHLEDLVPDVHLARLDEPLPTDRAHVRLHKDDRYWEGLRYGARLMTRTGKPRALGKKPTKVTLLELDNAAAASARLEKLAAAARKKGFG